MRLCFVFAGEEKEGLGVVLKLEIESLEECFLQLRRDVEYRKKVEMGVCGFLTKDSRSLLKQFDVLEKCVGRIVKWNGIDLNLLEVAVIELILSLEYGWEG